jgi:hypothetical protein
MDPSVIVDMFDYTTPSSEDDGRPPSPLSPCQWREMERLLKEAVKESSIEATKTLSTMIHHPSTQLDLERHKSAGLEASFATKNNRKDLKKAENKRIQAENKLQKEREAQEKRGQRERQERETERMNAEKAAEQQRKKAGRERHKAIKTAKTVSAKVQNQYQNSGNVRKKWWVEEMGLAIAMGPYGLHHQNQSKPRHIAPPSLYYQNSDSTNCSQGSIQ